MASWDSIAPRDVLGGEAGDRYRQRLADEHDDSRTWIDPNGYRLSDRIWSSREADRAAIEQVLRGGLAQGRDSLQTAKLVEGYLLPEAQNMTSRPRGGRGMYSARRLARTETTRAFGKATLDAAERNPWLGYVRWRLSASHPKQDICDNHAANSTTGQDRGVYRATECPTYPAHPHCLCTISPTPPNDAPTDAEIVAALREKYGLARPSVIPEQVAPPAPEPKRATRTRKTAPAPAPVVDDSWADAVLAMRRAKAVTDFTIDEIKEAGRLVRTGYRQRLTPELERSIDEHATLLKRKEEARLEAGRYRSARTDEDIRKYNDAVRTMQVAGDEADAIAATMRMSQKDSDAYRKLLADRRQAREDFDRLNRSGYPDFSDREASLNHSRMIGDARRREADADKALTKLANKTKDKPLPTADALKDALSKVRGMGSDIDHGFWTGSTPTVQKVVNGVRNYVPTDWWVDSNDYGQLISKKVKRAFYRHRGSLGELHVSGAGAEVPEVALHEFGHRIEYVKRHVRDAEARFYNQRTAGEPLVTIPGYGSSEKARLDQFTTGYIGKDYDGRAYEVLSMGLQDVMGSHTLPYHTVADEDFGDFILGVLALL